MNIENIELNGSNDEVDSETHKKLRGDAIGDTMYSQRFVLKTLLALEKLHWNNDVEDDLCFLWDMSADKEVCDYLMDMNFPAITISVILNDSHDIDYEGFSRLCEILVGIVANIVISDCAKDLETVHLTEILSLLRSTTNPYILIQLMRLIIANIHKFKNLTFLGEYETHHLVDVFNCILTCSANFELIEITLETIAKVTEYSKNRIFYECELMKKAISACTDIVTNSGECEFSLYSKQQISSVKHLIQYILNFSVLVHEGNDSFEEIIDSVSVNYLNLFYKLCQWYSTPGNLLPLSDEIIFFYEGSNYIFSTFEINFNSDIFKELFSILLILGENECDDLNGFIEMFCYFVYKGHSETENYLSSLEKSKVKEVYKLLEKHDLSFSFNFSKTDLSNLIKNIV